MDTHDKDLSSNSLPLSRRNKLSQSEQLEQNGFTISNPLDRLAANVIDIFFVLSPLLIVLIAPFKRRIREAILFGSLLDLILFSLLCAFIILLFTFVYKTYLTWRYGNTLGQWFMSLKVVDIWNPGRRQLGNYILRSVYWILSYGLLCIPFLSVISNEKRRCLHDRISDTIVLSLNGRVYPSPSSSERALSRMALSCVFFIAFLILLPKFFLLYENIKNRDYLREFFGEEKLRCSLVEEALSEWPRAEGVSRLSVAMALYAAAEIERPCLKKEVDFVYLSGGGHGIAHLASAFVHADDAELSDKYLISVCERYPDSESCQMSRIIELWSEDKKDEIDSLFEEFDSSPSTYITIWGIRHFYRSYKYVRSMEMLKSISHFRYLTDFLSLYRVKLHWVHMKIDKARVSAETAMTAMSESGRLNLSNWLCFEERGIDCQRRHSCDYMEKYWKQNPDSLGNHHFALTFLKNSICEGKDYESVKKKMPKGLVRDFTAALGSLDKQKILEGYLENNKLNFRLKAEVVRELISVDSVEKLKSRVEEWLKDSKSWEWEKTGRVLFQRLSQLKIWDRAYKVGFALWNRQPEDIQLQENLIVAAYKSDKVNQAQEMLSDYYQKKTKPRLQRSPASHETFFTVVRQLKSLEE